ncbi:hypothetical protein Tco_1021890 [Tanacetum coccineum]
MPIEETTSKALLSQCDGFGYDWSDQVEDGPTNFSLMAYTSLGSSNSSGSDNELNVAAYKGGLESVEARLVVHQKNETVYEEDIKILKIDVMLRDKALTKHRKRFEKAENERDELKLRLEKFENSSKNLSKLLDSQSARKDTDAPIIEDWESDSDEEHEPMSKVKKKIDVSKIVKTNYAKIEFVRPKLARKPVKQVRLDTNSSSNRAKGNQRN